MLAIGAGTKVFISTGVTDMRQGCNGLHNTIKFEFGADPLDSSAVWVFALSNAVNLIDGLDGLAGGIVAIASGTLCVYGLRLEDLGLLPVTNVGPLIAALTCGICLGFLRDNFHPAKLFMGDAGSLMLGLLMSASTQYRNRLFMPPQTNLWVVGGMGRLPRA